jgi:hypothetical protein
MPQYFPKSSLSRLSIMCITLIFLAPNYFDVISRDLFQDTANNSTM